MDMPRYQCHKIVRGAKIAGIRIFDDESAILTFVRPDIAPIAVDKDWMHRSRGSAADYGYYVLYEDGYASWSPTKAFEDGYTLIPETVVTPE